MVYVDQLIDYGWKLGPSCHLLADTEDELHSFAKRLGLKRQWVQRSRRGIIHYDLNCGKRSLALDLGAVEPSRDKLLELLKRKSSDDPCERSKT